MEKLFLASLALIFSLSNSYSQQVDHVLGEVIVQLQYGRDIQDLIPQLSHLNGKKTDVQVKKELSPPLRIWLLEFDFAQINEQDFLNKLKRINIVENAQFNHLGDYRQTVPDDPSFDQQWMWLNLGQSGGFVDADIDLDLAWDLTTGGQTEDGQEIVVCVVEGANRNHPDLQGNLWYNEAEIDGDGIDNDGNGYVDDYQGWHVNLENDNIGDGGFGHGTFVSGAVGAKGNNGLMVTGVNWNVKIMHVDFSGVSEANSIAAYTYPLIMRRKYNETGGQSGAFVVVTNSSWGTDGGNPANAPIWCAFYDSLGQEGILSCGATANNNVNVDIVGDLPTTCKSEFLISVTATDNKDERTFSGFGIENIDVAAPGEDFISINLNGGPASSSGTSFASPTVAGIIALLYSAPCSSLGAQALGAPAATAEFVRDAIFQGVDKIPNLMDEVKYGGRVNAFNSLQYILANCGPCPRPFGVQITDFDDVTATLEWFSTDSTFSTDMLFREVGMPTWQTINGISSPYFFSNLSPCTDYEIQLQDICANEVSGYSTSLIFQSDGCCVPPSELIVVDFDETNATVAWESIFAANGYNLLISSSSETELIENLTTTSYDFSNLDSCTIYNVQIQTVCDTGATFFSEPVEFKTYGCGSCTDLPYCLSNSVDAKDEWIANVTINNLNNSTLSNDGYGDFTNLSADLMTYQTYTIGLSPGYSGFGYNEWFTVFIDFNQDGDFDDSDEEVFDVGGTTNTPVQGSVFVPGDAVIGSTRMRVVMKFNNEPTACEQGIAHGEVEDYCVNIMEGVPISCEVPTMLIANNISIDSADFSWNRTTDAISYEVRVKPETVPNWQVILAQDTFFTASNLLECIFYECQVRSVCSGTKSNWSPSTLFKTNCIIGNANNISSELFDWDIFPNPFNEYLELNIILKKTAPVNIEIYGANGVGEYKKSFQLNSGENKLRLLSSEIKLLNNGIYFIKINTPNGFAIKRVVKM